MKIKKIFDINYLFIIGLICSILVLGVLLIHPLSFTTDTSSILSFKPNLILKKDDVITQKFVSTLDDAYYMGINIKTQNHEKTTIKVILKDSKKNYIDENVDVSVVAGENFICLPLGDNHLKKGNEYILEIKYADYNLKNPVSLYTGKKSNNSYLINGLDSNNELRIYTQGKKADQTIIWYPLMGIFVCGLLLSVNIDRRAKRLNEKESKNK